MSVYATKDPQVAWFKKSPWFCAILILNYYTYREIKHLAWEQIIELTFANLRFYHEFKSKKPVA